MKLLLDTHVLVWWMFAAPQLTKATRAKIADPSNLIFVSAASVWELRIKAALGKIKLPSKFAELLAAEKFENLAITWTHAHALRELPMHHRDPFDRLLIAQARVDNLVLFTNDEMVERYEVDYLMA